MEIKRMLRSFAAVLSCAVMMGYAAEPLCWERTPNRPAPAQFDTFHGQSLDFRCTFTGFGALPFSGSGAVAPRLYYQTNGMAAAWWSIPATVSYTVVTNCQPPITNYSLSAVFPPAADPGAERLTVFFGAPSNAYAAAQVRFRNSPGAHPNDLDPPSVLDWQAELAAATNDLFMSFAPAITNTYTKAETDARIVELSPPTSLAPATNYTDALQTKLENGQLRVADAYNAQTADSAVSAASASYATEAYTATNAGHAQQADELYDFDRGEYHNGSFYAAAADLAAASLAGTNYTDNATNALRKSLALITTNDVCNIVTATGNWEWTGPGTYIASASELPAEGSVEGETYFTVSEITWVGGTPGSEHWDALITMWQWGEEAGGWDWLETGDLGQDHVHGEDTDVIEFYVLDSTFTARKQNALGLSRLSDLAAATNSLAKSLAPTITNIASTVSSNAIANADTTYRRTIGLTNLNQSVQYVNITDPSPTTLAIQLPDGVGESSSQPTADWIVYITAVTNVALQLPAVTWWMADSSATNDIAPATPTAFYFSQITDGVFYLGRQELTPVTITTEE